MNQFTYILEKVKSTKVVQSQQPTDLYQFMITLILLNKKL